MAEFLTTIIAGNSNKGIGLQQYNGEISIVSVWEGRDGAPKINWCYGQVRENGESIPGKVMPLQLRLGDRKTAAAVLRQLLLALDDRKSGQPDGPSKQAVEDDIPF